MAAIDGCDRNTDGGRGDAEQPCMAADKDEGQPKTAADEDGGRDGDAWQPCMAADGDMGGRPMTGTRGYIPNRCSRWETARVMSSAKRLWSRRKSGLPSERAS